METNSSNRLTYFLVGAIVLCLAGLAYQNFEMRALRLQVTENRAAGELAIRDAVAVLAMSESQDARIESLENDLSPASGKLDRPTADKLDAIRPGLYQLKTVTQYDLDSEETSPYTITHVAVLIDYESYEVKVSIGIATSSMLIPKGVYFDYNNDGQVDADMALEFVRELPFGSRLAKVYDPDDAQNLYSIFVNEIELAEYTSIDDLANDAEASSNYVWTFVESQYEAIESWVLENLPEQPTEQ